jgi:type II secretory pathway component PulF
MQDAREKVSMAMTYPAIVLVVGAATMIFTMVFVVPRFSSIFAEMGGDLPLPTKMLIGMSSFLIQYGWLMALAIFGLFMLWKRSLKKPAGLRRWHGFQLRFPLTRSIITANAFSQFARTLSALLSNGVPVLQALSIVENTMGNVLIAGEIKEARERVTDGSTISGPLAAGKVFPVLLTDMLAVGEETGDMVGSLNHIGQRYEKELDRSVKTLTTVLEPIMIVVIALMVGFIAVSMVMAVLGMANTISTK